MIFGSLPVTPQEIVRRLCANVVDTARRFGGDTRTTPWTIAVNQVLEQLVIEHHGRASTHSAINPGGPTRTATKEFLLDFVWWDQEEADAYGRAIMGVECEWASAHSAPNALKEIAYDFRKLLCFKAPLKLFIYDLPASVSRHDAHATLCECLQKFRQHVKGELYLFVEFWQDKGSGIVERWKEKQSGRWKCDVHVYCPDQDGAVAAVVLSPLAGRGDAASAGS